MQISTGPLKASNSDAVLNAIGCKDPRARLDAVVAAANEALRASDLQSVGRLDLAVTRHERDDFLLGQLRSRPLERFANAEFRFDLPVVDSRVPDALCFDAEALRSSLTSFVEERERIRADVRAATNTTLAHVGRHSSGSVPIDLSAIGVSYPGAPNYHLVVELTTLGDDLTPGVERLHANGTTSLIEALDLIVESHARRERLLAELAADDAIGWIDGIAARILDVSGTPLEGAIETMRREGGYCAIQLGDPSHDGVRCGLEWREGVIAGSFEDYGKDLDHDGTELGIGGSALPDTVLTSAVGRSLGEILEHHLVPADCLITRTSRRGNRLMLELTAPKDLLRAGTRGQATSEMSVAS